MKNKNLKFLFILFFLICFKSVNSENKSNIVIKVNNKIITNIDVQNEKEYLIAINQNLKSLDEDEMYNIAKNSLIRERIKKNELEKYYNLNINSKYMDSLIKDFYMRLKFQSKEDFNVYLSDNNIDLNEIKSKLNIETIWNELIFNKYKDQVEIDEEKIKNKINTLVSKEEKESYLISEIVFSANTKEKILINHKKILKSIDAIGFSDTANIYSEAETSKFGGEIGWIDTSQFSEKIFKKLRNLKTGEITDLINVPGGFLILKIIDKKLTKIKIDKKNEFNQLITYEKNRQLNEFSAIYFQKIKKNSIINE